MGEVPGARRASFASLRAIIITNKHTNTHLLLELRLPRDRDRLDPELLDPDLPLDLDREREEEREERVRGELLGVRE